MQNSLSFLGGFNFIKPLASINERTSAEKVESYSANGFRFFNESLDHPLYNKIIIENNEKLFLLVQGFFYARLPQIPGDSIINEITIHNKYEALKKYLNNLNGNFNGFFIDHINKSLGLFTDSFGFEKIYYIVSDSGTNFSSSIWPLINPSNIHSFNPLAVGEHLTLGSPLNGRTIFNNIFTVPPGYIFVIDFTGHPKLQNEYLEFKSIPIKSSKKLIRLFHDVSEAHFTFIKNKINVGNIGMTLTGGNDTRVILNQMLSNGIKPGCITGYNIKPGKDVERAKKITAHFKLPFSSLNYTENFESILKDTLLISNGFTNGIWMANIAKKSMGIYDIMYYGFSGDLVSGGYEFDPENIPIESIAEKALKYKTYYVSLAPEKLFPLVSVSYDKFLTEYKETYLKYKNTDRTHTYFLQEKNERNHRRIASFADGSKLGPLPIYFFHDKEVLNFYRGLDKKWIKQQILHHKLSYDNNLFLALMPSANKTDIPSFMIPFISKILHEKLITKFKRLMSFKTTIPTVSLKSRHDFLQYIIPKQDYIAGIQVLDFLDIERFIKELPNKELAYQDAKLLQMRFLDILGTIKIANEI